MILITVEIRWQGVALLRLQAQSKKTIVVKGESYLFYPIGLGLPHETQTLSVSLRDLTIRSGTPTLLGPSIGEYAAVNNGLLGATVQTQVFDMTDLMTPQTATAVYREQVNRSRLNETDLALTLSTESQPLKFWTS